MQAGICAQPFDKADGGVPAALIPHHQMFGADAAGLATHRPGSLTLIQVHPGTADKARDKRRGGVVIQVHGRPHLFDRATVQHDDGVGHGHRLDLIMGDINHRRPQFGVQLGQYQPHLDAQAGIKVGQRFVEQEHLGVAPDGPPGGDGLTLATGQGLGFAVQQRGQLQGGGSGIDLLGNLGLGQFGQRQAEAAIVAAVNPVATRALHLQPR